MPRLYNLRRNSQCRESIPVDAIIIDRTSPWGNPYVVGRDGDREGVIAAFRTYAIERLAREPDWLEPLRGKDLACWCTPKACHGDVLMELLYGSELGHLPLLRDAVEAK